MSTIEGKGVQWSKGKYNCCTILKYLRKGEGNTGTEFETGAGLSLSLGSSLSLRLSLSPSLSLGLSELSCNFGSAASAVRPLQYLLNS